jgi:hypothetical protein
MNRKEISNLLNTYKTLIGLSDYKINLVSGYHDLGSNHIAEEDVDIYEKEIEIKLSNDFNELCDKKKRNVLLHEIIHARIYAYNAKLEEIIATEEELLVNDITNAVECRIK